MYAYLAGLMLSKKSNAIKKTLCLESVYGEGGAEQKACRLLNLLSDENYMRAVEVS